jgi:hypothetical protein
MRRVINLVHMIKGDFDEETFLKQLLYRHNDDDGSCYSRCSCRRANRTHFATTNWPSELVLARYEYRGVLGHLEQRGRTSARVGAKRD